MSDVEKKVVSVEFDNRKFDKNVKKSSKALDEFKEKLQVKDVSKSFDVLVKKFTALDYVAASVINNITNRVVNLGVRLVKSLSVDNISSGWDKFGLKTTSVATIAAQTIKIAGRELTNYEEKLEAINDQLDKLNWYTDETSYNFTDMVNTIGKFTAAGQDLDKSVNAMIGIANWAALSGQNASVASRAMYQLAQAMSKGNIQLIDWRSIETANMATMEFKQTVLDTAVAMGELTKQGENYISKTGKKITAITFSESLSDKWFTSDILVAALEKYSAAVDRVYELSEETGLTASEVMARYSSELDKFGLKAFKAAQEARTFADALNSVKDAVSTGWLNTFEKIFGGYDESRKLWTDLANELYEVFAEGGNFRNQILGIWNDLGGRSDLFRHGKEGKQGAFWNIYDSIVEVIKKFKEIKDEVFAVTIFENMDDKAKDLAYQLKNITDNMQRFTEKIKTAVKENKSFQGILKGLFSILKTIGQVMRGIRYALDPIITLISGLFSDILDRIGAFGSNLSVLERSFKAIENVASVINVLLDSLLNLLNIRGNLNALFDFIASIFGGTFDAAAAGKGIVDFFTNLGDSLNGFKNTIVSVVKGTKDSDIFGPLYNIIKGVVEFAKGIWAIISPVVSIIGKAFELVGIVLQVVGNFIKDIIDNGLNWKRLGVIGGIVASIAVAFGFFVIFYNLFYSIRNIISPLHQVCEDLGDAALKFANSKLFKGIAEIILNIGKSLLMIAAAFVIIGSMDTVSFTKAAITIGVLISLIGGIIIAVVALSKTVDTASSATKTLETSLKNYVPSLTQMFKQGASDIKQAVKSSFDYAMKLNAMANFVDAIGLAMLGVGIAFRLIGTLSWEEWGRAMIAMGAFAVLVSGMMFLAKKTDSEIDSKSIKKFGKSLIAFALAFRVIASILVKFSKIDPGKLWNAYGAFAAIAVLFVGLAASLSLVNNKLTQYAMVSKDTKVVKVANNINATMGSLLAALVGTAIMIAIFGHMDTGAVIQGGVTVGLILLSMIGIVALLNKIKTFGRGDDIAKMLLSLSATLLAFGVSMAMIQNIPWTTILTATGGLALVIGALIGMMYATQGMDGMTLIALGAAMAILAADLALFGVALLPFQSLGWQTIVSGMASLAGMIIIFTVAAKLLEGSLMTILLFPAAMLLMAASFLTSSVAMRLMAESIGPFLDSFKLMAERLGEILQTILQAIIDNSQLIVDTIVAMIQIMCQAIMDSSDVIVEMIIKLLDNLLDVMPKVKDVIVQLVNDIFDILETLLVRLLPILDTIFTAILDSIEKNAPRMIKITMDILVNILKALNDNAVELATNLFEALWKFIMIALDKLIENLPELIHKAFTLLKTLITSVFDELPSLINTLVNKLIDFIVNLLDQLGETIAARAKELGVTFVKFGKNLMKGLWNGMMAGLGELLKDIPVIGGAIENLFKDTLQIHSPSRMTARLGEYLMQGFAIGMDKESDRTMDQATTIMADCINTAIESAQNIIDEEDDALVLRPVLDLSNVEAGAHSLAGIMSGVGGASITADIASKASSDMARKANQNAEGGSSTTVNNAGDTYNNVFNITTDDPEELAREVDEIMQRQHRMNNLAKGGV